ncbi:MAG: ankyrin repeat domain-containing protein [Planctomycetota bacterium]|jgi:hypothetical protein
MKLTLPLVSGVLIILVFAVLMTGLVFWKPFLIRVRVSELLSNDFAARAGAVEGLRKLGDAGKKALIENFPDGEEAARYLLGEWENISRNNNSKTGWEIVDHAVRNGWPVVVSIVVGKGLDINERQSSGLSPLCTALQNGRKDMALMLLSHGADATAKGPCCWTPLHFASAWGFRDVAEILISKGASVNAPTAHGLTPLDVTIYDSMKSYLGSYGGLTRK